MKIHHDSKQRLARLGVVAVLSLGGILASMPAAGQFVLHSVSITAGGRLSSGGTFQLISTVGQAAAGPKLESSRFALRPGAMTFVTVQQTPGGPLLQIGIASDGRVVLSWPAAVKGFQLQYCTDLGSGDWQDETAPVMDTPTSHTVTVSSKGVRCYRLKK